MTDGYWTCSTCSWVNKVEGNTGTACQSCGRAAPPGATPVDAFHPVVMPSAPLESPATAYQNKLSNPSAYVPTYTPPTTTAAPYRPVTYVPATSTIAPVPPPPQRPVPPIVVGVAAQDHASVEGHVPDNLWLCSKCSWVNAISHSSCNACGHLAPPNVKITPVRPLPQEQPQSPYHSTFVPAAPVHSYTPVTVVAVPPGRIAAPYQQQQQQHDYPQQPPPLAYSHTYTPSPALAAQPKPPPQQQQQQQGPVEDDFVSGFGK